MMSDEQVAVVSVSTATVLVCLIIAVAISSCSGRNHEVEMACIKAGGSMERPAGEGVASCKMPRRVVAHD